MPLNSTGKVVPSPSFPHVVLTPNMTEEPLCCMLDAFYPLLQAA